MSHRLQVLIPPDLNTELRKSSARMGISTGEYVRRALRMAMHSPGSSKASDNPVAKLASLGAPTGDIDQMLDEIERGRF
jgi:hypothetical protein